MPLSVAYALPLTWIEIEGTVTITTDSLEAANSGRSATAVAAVTNGAGELNRKVELDGDWFRTRTSKLTLSEDGRLTSLEHATESQLGRVVLGVTGAAASIGATLIGTPALGAAIAATTARAAGFNSLKLVDDLTFKTELAEPTTEEDRVAAAYVTAHPDPAKLRAHFSELVTKTLDEIAQTAENLVEATPANSWPLSTELRRLQELLVVLRAELSRLDEHFRAWRTSLVSTRTEQHRRRFSLDHLAAHPVTVSSDGTIAIPSDAPWSVRDSWETLGIAVVLTDPQLTAPEEEPVRLSRRNEIVVRQPRLVRLSVYEKADDGKAVLQRTGWHRVVYSASALDPVSLEDGAAVLGFGDLGTVTSISSSQRSAAADAADTLGALPGTVTASLEGAVKARTALSALRSADVADDLDRKTKLVAIKSKELELAGLNATDDQYVELAKLKQDLEFATTNKGLRDNAAPTADPAAAHLAEVKAKLELLETERSVLVATRRLESEAELGGLRTELARITAEVAVLKARADAG